MGRIPERLNLPEVDDYPSYKREMMRAWTQMAQSVNNLFTVYYQDAEPVIPDNAMSLWIDTDGAPTYYLMMNFGGVMQKINVSSLDDTVPVGGVIGWSGNVMTIPANYHLCDGTGGTPDLSIMFIA